MKINSIQQIDNQTFASKSKVVKLNKELINSKLNNPIKTSSLKANNISFWEKVKLAWQAVSKLS